VSIDEVESALALCARADWTHGRGRRCPPDSRVELACGVTRSTLRGHASHFIAENRGRAVRDGLDGELVDLQTGVREPARARLARLLDDLEPHAAVLGCSEELAPAWAQVHENGADRQRAAAERAPRP
jgi:gamma-glutamyl:cysteine ligase YbdK (ATP-grasp superfamily)